jgi:hypothetical protein
MVACELLLIDGLEQHLSSLTFGLDASARGWGTC